MSDEPLAARLTGRYPDPDASPADFERFVADLFRVAEPQVKSFSVVEHDVTLTPDGKYDLDTTIRFELLGAHFLVLVEAKMHKNPIKRDLVQILHQKIQSIGAHKGILVSTSRFQAGAVQYALSHGIALVKVTEGRFIYETRSREDSPPLSQEGARELEIPQLVGHHYHPGKGEGSIGVTLISPEYPKYVLELLAASDSDID